MVDEFLKYHPMAQTCTFYARAFSDLPTSCGLEEVATDLMAEANEPDRLVWTKSNTLHVVENECVSGNAIQRGWQCPLLELAG